MSTYFEFKISTISLGKEYKDLVKLYLQKWKLENWVDCKKDITLKDWFKCLNGYGIFYESKNISQIPQCLYVYNAEYQKVINMILLYISLSITAGFIILYLMKEKIFMHAVVYLENFILSITMVVFFCNKYNFVADDPFILKFDFENGDTPGYFSYVLPFSPISSLLVHIPIPIRKL